MNFAVISGLLKCKHKVAVVTGTEIQLFEENEKQKKGFTLNQIPCLFTFAVFNDDLLDNESNNDIFLLDPAVF